MSEALRTFVLRGVTMAVVLVSGAAANAQTCFVVDPVWQQQHIATQGALVGLVQGLQTAVSESLALSNEMYTSAVKVFTKQVDTSGQRVNTNKVGVNQALAATLMQEDRNQRVVKAKEDYGISTGQGVNACKTISMMNGVNAALQVRSETALSWVSALDVSPGSAKSMPDAVKLRLANAARSDAAVLFDTSADDSSKSVVLAHMAGLPPAKPDSRLKGAEAEYMMQQARRIESLRSPALASLAAVAASSSKGSHGGTDFNASTFGDDLSMLEGLDKLIEQYGGGAAYDAWSAGLAGQAERGLLIELTRLRAMNMKLRQVDTEQRARLTAVVAALLALETGGL
ncbi:hypothetical protein V5F40_21550 [Xanthobacter sp. DSM 14520]|uniref:hypothetical protein n=1 Tax=Xanthobacter autotrophicus (strain ATCC BAA-1158 / Py2) TaxID=78245 RepID=UPI003729CE1A